MTIVIKCIKTYLLNYQKDYKVPIMPVLNSSSTNENLIIYNHFSHVYTGQDCRTEDYCICTTPLLTYCITHPHSTWLYNINYQTDTLLEQAIFLFHIIALHNTINPSSLPAVVHGICYPQA